MKKSINVILMAMAALLVPCCVSAQEECGFEKIDVRKDFTENGFQWFRNAEILAAGDSQSHNAMTIGWGGIGTLWGRTALTVYVAEKRYTKEFMDRAQYFTVMAFDSEEGSLGERVLTYMGTKSGRDGDKAAALGLHTAYTANGTPYYTEAALVIECKTMYAAPFAPQYFRSDVPKNRYSNFPAGLHTMYVGEVVGAWRKQSAQAENQKPLKKVYDETLNPMEQIDQAVAQAKREGKFTICQVGGNWCPWCLRFADFIERDTVIGKVVNDNFVYVHVNYNPRKSVGEEQVRQAAELMKRLGDCGRFGFPVFVVLDEEGRVLHIQDSSFLEEGQGYSQERVLRFLKTWTPDAVRKK